jgi:hypothetical protein
MMIQCRRRPGFPLDTFGEVLLGDFDRHDAVQTGIAGAVDVAHTSCAIRARIS